MTPASDWRKYWHKHPCADCGKPVNKQSQRCHQCAPKHTALHNASWREKVTAYLRSPGCRLASAEAVRIISQQPWRRAQLAAISSRPKPQAKRSDSRSTITKAMWEGEEFRSKVTNSLRASKQAAWSNPQRRSELTASLKASHLRPEVRRKLSALQKASWATGKRHVNVGNFREKYLLQHRTSIEANLETALIEARQVYAFEHQVGPYFIDFVVPERKVALECDWPICNKTWHKHCGHTVEHDKKRDKYLLEKGWVVCHIPHSKLQSVEQAKTVLKEVGL